MFTRVGAFAQMIMYLNRDMVKLNLPFGKVRMNLRNYTPHIIGVSIITYLALRIYAGRSRLEEEKRLHYPPFD